MAQYKRLSLSFLRLFSWIFLLLLTSGITIGAPQFIEDAQSDESVQSIDATQPVDRGPSGAIIFPNNQGVGSPGNTVIYQHTVRNSGAGSDTFDLTAESSQGWSTNVSPEELTLNGNGEMDIFVTIVVAQNAQAGDVDVTTVTVTSQSDPGITDFSTDTTTVPLPMYLPLVANNAGHATPNCELTIHPPANPPGIDLVVTGISLLPGAPQPGQETTVRVTVKNQGDTDVLVGNNFIVDFYDNPMPEPPGTLQPGVLYWGLQGADFIAGRTMTLVGTYTFASGSHHLYAQIDTDDVVIESDENNNVYGCLGININ